MANLTFTTIAQGTSSGEKRQRNEVITRRDKWSRFWGRHTSNVFPAPELPKVNFKQQIVLAVYVGDRDSGDTVEIEKIEDDGNYVTVTYRVKSDSGNVDPSGGGIGATTTVQEQPFHIVRIAHPDNPVRFREAK